MSRKTYKVSLIGDAESHIKIDLTDREVVLLEQIAYALAENAEKYCASLIVRDAEPKSPYGNRAGWTQADYEKFIGQNFRSGLDGMLSGLADECNERFGTTL